MKRRGFLKRLVGLATAAVVSETVVPDDGVSLYSLEHPFGMGLAPLKPEGGTIPYDLTEESLEAACVEILEDPLAVSRSGILTRSDFAKQLADGLNKCFEEAYADYEPDGWPKPDG